MATPFTFEAVADNIPVGGAEVSLTLDKSGNPRVAFCQQGSAQIVVAQRDGGTWTHQDVPGGFLLGDGRPCLAIDSQGNPQLGYRDLNSGVLMHAIRNSAGRWSFTPVPTNSANAPGGVGGVAFALHPGREDTESRDAAFFAYVDLATDGIGFAQTSIFGPSPVMVQDNVTRFTNPSVAFDSSENFFIAYVGIFDTGSPQDRVSVRATHVTDIEHGTFSEPVLIEESQFINVRRPTSIARTFSGGCLAYFDIASKTMKASVTADGVSGIETVAAKINNTTAAPSAAVKGTGFRVAYADADAIKLASRSPSGTWTVEVVDAVVARSPSLAYDNAGTANIAYVAGGKLKYARRSE